MSDQTRIEWADSTFNPWMGCTKVSPACDHCYAERDTKRFGRVEWGAGKPRVRTSAANWKLPERWNREAFVECTACGARGDDRTLSEGDGECRECRSDASLMPVRRRVFSASLADWLDNEVPIEWLVDLLDLIRRTPNLDWLLLTKRIGNWEARLLAARDHLLGIHEGDELIAWIQNWRHVEPPTNVWIGATVIDQKEADRDVPKLLRVPARVRFLSIEPMLGDISLASTGFEIDMGRRLDDPVTTNLHWVISGGESGPHARPMHPDWVRSLRDQCEGAGVPFLFKQWGEWQAIDDMSISAIYRTPGSTPGVTLESGVNVFRVGKKAAGRLLDGVAHNGFPCA